MLRWWLQWLSTNLYSLPWWIGEGRFGIAESRDWRCQILEFVHCCWSRDLVLMKSRGRGLFNLILQPFPYFAINISFNLFWPFDFTDYWFGIWGYPACRSGNMLQPSIPDRGSCLFILNLRTNNEVQLREAISDGSPSLTAQLKH